MMNAAIKNNNISILVTGIIKLYICILITNSIKTSSNTIPRTPKRILFFDIGHIETLIDSLCSKA